MIQVPRQTYKPEVRTSYRSPRFHSPGDTFVGLLLKPPVERQKTKFGSTTGELETWPDGNPRLEYVYTFLKVSETEHPKTCYHCGRSKERTDEDDGGRVLYASYAQHKAIQNAIASAKAFELYGPVAIKYAADDKANQKAGQDPRKLWGTAYRVPTDDEVARCDLFLGNDTTPQNNTTNGGISDAEVQSLLSTEPVTLEKMKEISGK